MSCLNSAEMDFFELLKQKGILTVVEKGKKWCNNGGVLTACGDGHRDIISFHKNTVHRQTSVQTAAGGPLIYAFDFLVLKHQRLVAKYKDKVDASTLTSIIRDVYVDDIITYMSAKKTKTTFLAFHYPCGAAENHGISLPEMVLIYIPEVIEYFKIVCQEFPKLCLKERVHWKLHLNKKVENREEESTYKINDDILLEKKATIAKKIGLNI